MTGPPPPSWAIDPAEASAQLCHPDLWRLRLPLPWPGNGHVNAYVVARDDGVMLVDSGSAGHPSCALALEGALRQTGHELGDVRLVSITHAHSDHVGLAAWVQEQSGCEVWMHGSAAHFYDAIREPARIASARERRARQEGVPQERLGAFRDVREELEGAPGALTTTATLHDGVKLASRLGDWEVVETPGHAPSHVCLVQRELGLAIVGDTICSAFVPWFDYGYSFDPIDEFVGSLDRLVGLQPLQLALPGHGRPIAALEPLVASHRAGVAERLETVRRVVAGGGAATVGAFAVARAAFGAQASEMATVEKTTETAVYLRHLRLTGEVRRAELDDGRFRYESVSGGK